MLWLQISNDIDKLTKDIEAAKKKKQDLTAAVAKAKEGKEDSVSQPAGNIAERAVFYMAGTGMC